jgi:hypothetical protein
MERLGSAGRESGPAAPPGGGAPAGQLSYFLQEPPQQPPFLVAFFVAVFLVAFFAIAQPPSEL